MIYKLRLLCATLIRSKVISAQLISECTDHARQLWLLLLLLLLICCLSVHFLKLLQMRTGAQMLESWHSTLNTIHHAFISNRLIGCYPLSVRVRTFGIITSWPLVVLHVVQLTMSQYYWRYIHKGFRKTRFFLKAEPGWVFWVLLGLFGRAVPAAVK